MSQEPQSLQKAARVSLKFNNAAFPRHFTSAAEGTTRNEVIWAAHSKCSFRDPVTGRTCESSHQIQLDHIIHKALGGSDHPSNLRVLCRQHNLLMAERVFGKPLMEKYRQRQAPH